MKNKWKTREEKEYGECDEKNEEKKSRRLVKYLYLLFWKGRNTRKERIRERRPWGKTGWKKKKSFEVHIRGNETRKSPQKIRASFCRRVEGTKGGKEPERGLLVKKNLKRYNKAGNGPGQLPNQQPGFLLTVSTGTTRWGKEGREEEKRRGGGKKMLFHSKNGELICSRVGVKGGDPVSTIRRRESHGWPFTSGLFSLEKRSRRRKKWYSRKKKAVGEQKPGGFPLFLPSS